VNLRINEDNGISCSFLLVTFNVHVGLNTILMKYIE